MDAAVLGLFGFLSFLAFLVINIRKNHTNNYLLSERSNQCEECGTKRDTVDIMQPVVDKPEDNINEQSPPLERFELFHPNGVMAVEGHMLDGRLHGTRKSWNRKKEATMICNFDNGLLHGSWERYFSNGQVMSSGMYERVEDCSICVSQTRHYYEDGTLREVETYNRYGLKHGNQEFYKKDGTLIKIDVYNDGQYVNSIDNQGGISNG